MLIDTAGIRRRSKVEDLIEKVSVAKTLQAMDYAHVVIMVLDAHDSIGEQDASVLGMALERGRALLIAINKWDGIPMEQRDEIRRQLALKLDFVPYAPLHFISARHGTGVGELVDSAVRGFESAMREMPTRVLNRTLEAAMQAHQPPMVHGRRIKLRYVHQGGRNPPRVIVHGNQGERVPDAYARYLANVFRKTFELYATPVVVEFRTDANPFSERRTEHKVGHRPRRKGTANTGHRGAALAKIADMKAVRKKRAAAAAGAPPPARAGVRPPPKGKVKGAAARRPPDRPPGAAARPRALRPVVRVGDLVAAPLPAAGRGASRLARPDEGSGRGQEQRRIHEGLVQHYREVQVRAGHAAGHPHRADGLPASQRLADMDPDRAQVAVNGHQALAVIDDHGVAVEEIVAGVHHGACGSAQDRGAGGRRDVHACVGIAGFPVEHAAQPE